MKRKFYSLMLVMAMIAMTLVGCGSDATDIQSTTVDSTETLESTEEVVSETTTTEPEEIVNEEDEKTEKSEFTYAETLVYPDIFRFPETAPEGMEGYTEKYLDENYPDWSMNKTHYIDGNGNEMNFVWEGPIGLGADDCSVFFNVLHFTSKGEFYFNASTEGKITPERFDEIKTFDKEEITKLAIDEAPYIENGYYDANINDNFMTLTYETEQNMFRGYSHFILDREKGIFYKFLYFEQDLDETRALDVINSIDIWTDYESNGVSESETPEFKYAYTWAFPEPMVGFTRKYLNETLTEWSINNTHYIAKDGTEMNFTWEGPALLGASASAGEKNLYLYGENCELIAWTYGYVDGDYESCLEIDKETWTGYAPDDIPYEVDGYYNVETTEDVIKVVFAVGNDNYKGYNCYITDSTNAICYQFAYHENIETYDDNRAMNVVNSIEYWDYIPEE